MNQEITALEAPFSAYCGEEPYVFVCYAHADKAYVYTEISWLKDQGVNVYYDEGVSPGQEWSEELAIAIRSASYLLFFASSGSIASKHCRNEIHVAQRYDVKILTLFLEAVELPPGLEMTLGATQGLDRRALGQERFRGKLLEAIRSDRGQVTTVAAPGSRNPISVLRLGGFATAVAMLGVVAWLAVDAPPAEQQDACEPLRIAVLPFTNLSGNSDKDYFGDGMANQVWTTLAGMGGPQMISMRSARSLSASNLDLRTIGEELNAHYIVDGNVSVGGGLARVDVNLFAVDLDAQRWSTQLDADVSEIEKEFELYDRISSEIAGALPIAFRELTVETTQPPTDVPAAWEAFQRAGYEPSRTGRPVDALPLLTRAIELDPDFALAIAAKGAFTAYAAQFSNLPSSAFDEAEDLLLAAKALDAELPNVYSGLAAIYQNRDLDYGSAINALKLSLQFGAQPERISSTVADLMLQSGEWEAGLALTDLVIELNPENTSVTVGQRARFLSRLGSNEAAVEFFEQGLAEAPENTWLGLMLARHYYMLGDVEPIRELLARFHPRMGLAQGYVTILSGSSGQRDALIEDAVSRSNWKWLFDLGAYEKHIIAFPGGMQHFTLLDWLRQRPDYWDRLDAWAESEPDSKDERGRMLAEHRRFVAELTRKARFPQDPMAFVESLRPKISACAPRS